MRTFTKISILMAIIFMVANLSIAQTPNSKPSGGKLDIDTFIAGQMDAFHVPGLSACIIVGDEVVWNNNYGYMNLEDSIPVNDNTLFNAFSISKSFTAVCVMQQWENGNLDIDSDFNNYLPFDVINPNFPDVNITSRMLLCHSSSISDLNLMNYASIGDPTSSLNFFCENYFPEGGQYYNTGNYYNQSPGLYFHYSNLGVGLNGYLVEAISSTEFHEYAKESLLSPLNMEQSAWFLDELNLDNLATGYDYEGGAFTPNFHMGHPCYPGLSLRSTALELGQFVIMMLNQGQYQGNEVLQSSTIDTMLTVQNPNWGFSYGTTGLGVFMRTDYGNRTVWGHNGMSGGYAAHYYFCPDENTGIVIMTNSNQYVDPIVEYMFDYAYELANPPAVSQIQFQGLYSEGEGAAAWDANGSGPEPYGNGHGSFTYYVASRDYVDSSCVSGAHMLDNMNGFPLFQQALLDNGFTAEQLTLKISLSSMGEDIEGIDWFQLGTSHYANFYPAKATFDLDGEPLFEAIGNYTIYISRPDTREFESGFLKVNNHSANSPDPVKNVAAALLADLGNEELKLNIQVSDADVLSGSGRSGGYFNINCTLEKGLPTIPFQGLYANHEGFAGWDADGSGIEPAGDGHGTQLFYGASLDYDDIDSDPNACLGHFLDEQTGFLNTSLQLQYRDYEIGDLKVKLGLESLGPDVEGEDWGPGWSNYYNNSLIVEVGGESILAVMQDTNKLVSMGSYWLSGTSFGQVYDISANTSTEAQYVAQSFLKDMGTHFLRTNVDEINYVMLFDGNGRNGAIYEITEGAFVGIHEAATFISEGPVSGTWTAENSPYYVDGHLTVENGETLSIEPGVKIAVRGPYHFNVQGAVVAEGTVDENIVFTRSNPNLWWDGVEFINTPSENDSSKFDHCVFRYAYAQNPAPTNSGGAIAIQNFDKVSLTNSVFEFNKADIPSPPWTPSGGALAIFGSSPLIQKCIFRNNTATDAGAIIVYSDAAPIISNCLFYDNQAASDAGAIEFNTDCNGVLINNTFADNQAVYGGAIQLKTNSSPLFINNILWDNKAEISGSQIQIEDAGCKPGFYYCDIEEGQAGFGGVAFTGDYLFNIEDDPEFETGSEYPPYMLSAESPCFNVGTPDSSAWFYQQYLPENCLCGNPRVCNGRIEIGAYELLIENMEKFESANDNFSIFPNPFHQNLTISFELENATMVNIEIYNSLGEKVDVVSNTTLPAGKHTLNRSIPELPEGIYFCRLQVGGEVFTQKIVKQ